MATRISGVIMAPGKHIVIALRGVYGIGATRAKQICEKVSVNPATKVSELADDVITSLQKAVNEYIVEGDLRREVQMGIKRLKDIKCYRGLRHRRNLPCRGQRTKTNARTRKGKKRGTK